MLSYRRPPQLWRYTGAVGRAARHVDAFIAMSEFSRAKHAEFGFEPEMEVVPYFLPDPDPDEVPAPLDLLRARRDVETDPGVLEELRLALG